MQFTGTPAEAFGGLIGRRTFVNGTSKSPHDKMQYLAPLLDDDTLIGEYDVTASWALTCTTNCSVSPICRNRACDDWNTHWKPHWDLQYDVRGCAGLDGSRPALKNDDLGCWVGCKQGFAVADPTSPTYAFCAWRPDDPYKMYVRLQGYQPCMPITCSADQWKGTMVVDGAYWRLTRTLRLPPPTWVNPYSPAEDGLTPYQKTYANNTVTLVDWTTLVVTTTPYVPYWAQNPFPDWVPAPGSVVDGVEIAGSVGDQVELDCFRRGSMKVGDSCTALCHAGYVVNANYSA